jgi:S1-C subfamily serine protease
LGPRQVITAVDDKLVTSVGEWSRLVKTLKPGDTVKIDVWLGDRNEIFFLSVPQPKPK